MSKLLSSSQIIVALGAAFASLAGAQEPGLTVTLSGQGTVFAQATPVVRIEFDSSTIFISNPVSHSPYFQMNASASPPGGSFQWDIVAGSDKVKFFSATAGSLADHVTLRGTAPSEPTEMYGDVGIKVTYTIDSQAAEDSKYISVVKPSSLEAGGPLGPALYEAGYQVGYSFQVMDQVGNPLLHEMEWADKCSKDAASDKRLWNISKKWGLLGSGGGSTDENGVFYDVLAVPELLPLDSFLQVEQQITVEGWDVGTRYQRYYSDYAESIPVP